MTIESLSLPSPCADLLSREVLDADVDLGVVRVAFRARPEFLNRHGTVQGGMLSAMLDSATSLALYAVLPPEETAVTTHLNVSFLKPARGTRFIAHARLTSREGTKAHTEGELVDEQEQLIARARAILRIMPRKHV